LKRAGWFYQFLENNSTGRWIPFINFKFLEQIDLQKYLSSTFENISWLELQHKPNFYGKPVSILEKISKRKIFLFSGAFYYNQIGTASKFTGKLNNICLPIFLDNSGLKVFSTREIVSITRIKKIKPYIESCLYPISKAERSEWLTKRFR